MLIPLNVVGRQGMRGGGESWRGAYPIRGILLKKPLRRRVSPGGARVLGYKHVLLDLTLSVSTQVSGSALAFGQ